MIRSKPSRGIEPPYTVPWSWDAPEGHPNSIEFTRRVGYPPQRVPPGREECHRDAEAAGRGAHGRTLGRAGSLALDGGAGIEGARSGALPSDLRRLSRAGDARARR